MFIAFSFLVQIVVVLAAGSGWLYYRYRSQRKAIDTYIEVLEKPLPPPKITKEKKTGIIKKYLNSAVSACEKHFDNQPNIGQQPEEIDENFDKDAHSISIRHAILSAELQAIEEDLSPASDPEKYWSHFKSHVGPLLDCFDTLTEKAIEKNNVEWEQKKSQSDEEWQKQLRELEQEWKTKLQAQEEALQAQQDLVEGSNSTGDDSNDELQELRTLYEQLLKKNGDLQEQIDELESGARPSDTGNDNNDPENLAMAIAAAMAEAAIDDPSDHMELITEAGSEPEQEPESAVSPQPDSESDPAPTTPLSSSDAEQKEPENEKYNNQDSLINSLIAKLNDYLERYRKSVPSGSDESSDPNLRQLRLIFEDSNQLKREMQDTNSLIQQLERENDQLINEINSTRKSTGTSHAEVSPNEATIAKTQPKSAEDNSDSAEQNKTMSQNNDYADIIRFISQALNSQDLETMATDMIRLFSQLHVDSAIKIITPNGEIIKKSKQMSATVVKDNFKTIPTTPGSVDRGNITMHRFPNLGIMIEGLPHLEEHEQKQVNHILHIVGNFADEMIFSANSETEVDNTRALLKQTIVTVYKSAKNIDAKFKQFCIECTKESDNLQKLLMSETMRLKLTDNEKEKLIVTIKEAINASNRTITKSRSTSLVKDLVQSVEPVLNDLRVSQVAIDASARKRG